jgi:alkylation response protein AidB-like acyl-CoA dehydrogenase
VCGPVAYPAPPGPTHGHQSGPRADHPCRRPLTKLWFNEPNLEVAEAAPTLQGARSLGSESGELSHVDGRWQEAFLYARAWTIAGGSNEIMRNLIAQRGLWLPREPRGQT